MNTNPILSEEDLKAWIKLYREKHQGGPEKHIEKVIEEMRKEFTKSIKKK